MHNRAIALAALTQAVYLVDAIARKGLADAEDSRALIESIFIKSEEYTSPADIYGSLNQLRTGIRVSREILVGRAIPQSKILMSYCAGLLTIEQRLNKDSALRGRLAEGMIRIDKQRHYFGSASHPSVIAAIADLYGETISTMKPRIIVRGKTEHLSQSENTRRVRTLLMAGLRAAHIWRNNGGGHLTLLFRRKGLLRELDQLQDSTSRI
ncbi:high frequency lysogenization protein [Mariprofundus ferrinatatus]|uniref:High frequency lysogenization protein n=2 Tax=Mariprofundus ferrinatatus TaxID=1921087 RepID=A0A2K8L2L4_9PROT|nr:high frequency lysogenization protein [Mariprofundus ferrinatatus]